MRDRLTTLGLALLALLAFWILFLPHPKPQEIVSVPSSQDRGERGLALLYQWLETRGNVVESQRARLTALNRKYATGHTLLIHAAAEKALEPQERPALREWVRAGNTLVILLPWANVQADDSAMVDGLLRAFSMQVKPVEGDEAQKRIEQGRKLAERTLGSVSAEPYIVVPARTHALLQGVRTVRASRALTQDGVAEELQFVRINDDESENKTGAVSNSNKTLPTEVQLLRDAKYPMAWLFPQAAGQLIILGHSEWFSNSELTTADNAVFAENVLTVFKSAAGTILFDDFHQGLSNDYDVNALLNDRRLYQSIGVLVLFWLCYVLSRPSRLLGLARPIARPDSLAFTSALSHLYTRHLGESACANELLHHLRVDLKSRYGALPDNHALLQRIANDVSVPPLIRQRLKTAAHNVSDTKQLRTLARAVALVRLAIFEPHKSKEIRY
jgi:Domain of unknown function (DUF4350)